LSQEMEFDAEQRSESNDHRKPLVRHLFCVLTTNRFHHLLYSSN